MTACPSPVGPRRLHAADINSLPVTDWEDTTEPKLGGKALPLQQYETARSLAIAPDAQSFVLGAEWRLRRFDKDGKQLWEKPVPGIAWGVNLAREGRLILAAYGDGTIRWHRAADGEELLALFIHVPEDPKADKRWVLWTPEGYYTASPGGRGPDRLARQPRPRPGGRLLPGRDLPLHLPQARPGRQGSSTRRDGRGAGRPLPAALGPSTRATSPE